MIPALVDLMSTYHQAGNLMQMAAIARSLLLSIPEDVVALQFLGLALYRMGRLEAAREVFSRAVAAADDQPADRWPTTGERAADIVYREATRPSARLADAWQRIAQALLSFGFGQAAARAYRVARIAGGLSPNPRPEAPDVVD